MLSCDAGNLRNNHLNNPCQVLFWEMHNTLAALGESSLHERSLDFNLCMSHSPDRYAMLQGRRWAQVQPHLEEMWVMTMRAMDDVKESCRVAAATTMRTLQSVTLRLADPAASAEGDAVKAVDMMLPFMLDKCKRASALSVKAQSLVCVRI